MESYDAAMHPLLNTTAAGYAAIRKKKVHTALAVSKILYVLWNIPDLLTYFRIDHGEEPYGVTFSFNELCHKETGH